MKTLTEHDMGQVAQIKVLDKNRILVEVVVIQNPDGTMAEYDGRSRAKAFHAVFGRNATRQEVIDQTVLFCPRHVKMVTWPKTKNWLRRLSHV